MATLRDFAHGLYLKFTLRVTAELLGLQREALRKFIHGKTENPRDSTRQRIAEAYLAVHPGGAGAVREVRSEVPLPTPDEFRIIFENREDALRKFADLFARVPTGEEGSPPAWAVATPHFMKRLANAAFQGGAATYRPRTRSAGKGGAAKKRSGNAGKKPPAKPRKKRDDEG